MIIVVEDQQGLRLSDIKESSHPDTIGRGVYKVQLPPDEPASLWIKVGIGICTRDLQDIARYIRPMRPSEDGHHSLEIHSSSTTSTSPSYRTAAMFYNNPFDSWASSGSGQPTGAVMWDGTNPAPSVFGALPYPADPSTMHSFFFTSYNPNIFNCTIVGPKAQPAYQIVTDNSMPGYSVVKNVQGQNVSLVEWQAHPAVEIRGMVSKQHVKDWLRLSQTQDSRAMEVRGMKYMWVPRDKTINLYAATTGTPTFMARINRSNGAIVLEMTADAMQLGLLEPTITACLLLQCGRNID